MPHTKGECKCATTILEGHKLTDYLCPKHKAAPDMYEALKECLSEVESLPAIDLNFNRTTKIINAKNALAKAEDKA